MAVIGGTDSSGRTIRLPIPKKKPAPKKAAPKRPAPSHTSRKAPPGGRRPIVNGKPSNSRDTRITGDLAGVPYASLFEKAGKKHGVDPRLLAAIAKAESGFNPRAGSPAGAQGLMQFMPDTARSMGVDPWDPASAIDGAARYMKRELKRFDGRVDLALAAYNAGAGAVQKYNGVPPYAETQNYVKKIQGFLGTGNIGGKGGGGGGSSSSGGGGGGSSSGGGGGGGLDYEETWDRDDFEAALAASGFGSHLINADKELKNLFAKAIQGMWTPERFAGEVRSTKWYRARSATQRDYDTKRKNDPKTWAAELREHEQRILTMSNSFGVGLSKGRISAMAKAAYRNGMSDDELSRAVAAEFAFDPKKSYSGLAGQTINAVRDLASAYGIKQTDKTLGSTAEDILTGRQSEEGLQNAYREMAKKQYAHFAAELDSGLTMAQIAEPYAATASEILEINPQEFRVTDKTIQLALNKKDDKTGKARALQMWEYEEALKNDERWLKTNNARESMLSMGRGLLSSFGLAV